MGKTTCSINLVYTRRSSIHIHTECNKPAFPQYISLNNFRNHEDAMGSSAQENSRFWYWLRKHKFALTAIIDMYTTQTFILLKCVCAFLILEICWASIFAYHFLKSPHYLICFSSSGGSFCLGPIVIFSYAIFLKSINNVCLVLKKKKKYIIKKNRKNSRGMTLIQVMILARRIHLVGLGFFFLIIRDLPVLVWERSWFFLGYLYP